MAWTVDTEIERCKREIAAIEAEILAGNRDLSGLSWRFQTGMRNGESSKRRRQEKPPKLNSVADASA